MPGEITVGIIHQYLSKEAVLDVVQQQTNISQILHFPKKSKAKADQIRALDKARLIKKIGTYSAYGSGYWYSWTLS